MHYFIGCKRPIKHLWIPFSIEINCKQFHWLETQLSSSNHACNQTRPNFSTKHQRFLQASELWNIQNVPQITANPLAIAKQEFTCLRQWCYCDFMPTIRSMEFPSLPIFRIRLLIGISIFSTMSKILIWQYLIATCKILCPPSSICSTAWGYIPQSQYILILLVKTMEFQAYLC